MTDPARFPVIVGIGEVADRPDPPGRGPIGPEAATLMAEALAHAEHDASGGRLSRLASLDVVNAVSWPMQTCRPASPRSAATARRAWPKARSAARRLCASCTRRHGGLRAGRSRWQPYVAARSSTARARRGGLDPARDATHSRTVPDPVLLDRIGDHAAVAVLNRAPARNAVDPALAVRESLAVARGGRPPRIVAKGPASSSRRARCAGPEIGKA